MNPQAVHTPNFHGPLFQPRGGDLSAGASELLSTTDTLARLAARIDAALDSLAGFDDPSEHPEFARQLRFALGEAATASDILKPEQRIGDPKTYRRHLVMADPEGRYSILALVWGTGQWSPVHAHKTWCGYTVLDGMLDETVYLWNDTEENASPAFSHPRPTGAVSFVRAGRQAIHRLGNGGIEGSKPAVSLHVYGVPGDRITTHINDVTPTV
jgi:predicted metal-dependent enzyme (double-stranded beta helix superfamily)